MSLCLWVIDWFFSRRSPRIPQPPMRLRGTPLYKLYRYVLPHRVGFLRRFGLESGMVCEGNMGVNERIHRFNSK